MRLDIITEEEQLPGSMDSQLSLLGDLALSAEGLQGAYQASLIITDDAGIAVINRRQRGIDGATDVLSFPSASYPGGTARDFPKRLKRERDADTGCIHLGDLVLSLPRAREQAAIYGHSLMRECGFLFVHGMLHLMGYDHETDKDRALMCAMEDTIMEKAGLSRELTDAEFALVACAREAMQSAYVPYSKYRVGACVRAADGRTFKGCNVENASYGMTICAERNAITTAVAEGAQAFETIAIVAEGSMPYPCGACRQFLREFARDMQVIIASEDTIDVTTLAELLPKSFGPESLSEVKR